MASTMKAFIDKIMQDTEKNTRGIVNGAAKKARVDFTKEAKRLMDNYYREYSSDNYERTDTLRDYGYAPYTLWNANKIQTGVRFTDRGADFSKVYNRDVGAKDGWGSGIGGIIMSDFAIGAHGWPGYSGTFIGTPVGEKMEKFEETYIFEMDSYFQSQGLRRIV